ncbi:unnamed protein product [Plutella xylostella]|uniref:(diamondback moth) hypothetical protein n=1 Tax=Plutella xylostella TaxID=51655 RepID=A0A8S4D2S6_PLUXY|nr:unnamed protein product [Plutella xylostella]
MEGKKISFGFKMTKKAVKPVIEEKKEFIECLEEQAIKIIGGEVIKEKAPLIIPMKPNTLITAERLKQIAEEVESAVQEPLTADVKSEVTVKEEPMDEAETLDQMAVRELLQEAKKTVKVEKTELTVPIPALPKLDGQKESTLDDYESVPIQDFGLAMLRGMGWAPGKEQAKFKEPQLRPKGLGLGADKMVKQNQKKAAGKGEEELTIVKNAFVKITSGKYSGFYGKVVSLDEDNGRVMVDISVKKEMVSLSEFMMQPVSKSEFDKSSRVINADKYEEYKNNEPQRSTSRRESPRPDRDSASNSNVARKEDRRYDDIDKESRRKRDSPNGRGREERRRRDSSSSEDRSRQRKQEKKKYSSNDSLSSISDSEKKRRHYKEKKRHSSESDSSDSYKKVKKSKKHRNKSPDGKRDIDKKRKGKKKKRDRDRSPNYKKHRK